MNYYKEIASALIYATLFEEFEVCIISTIYVVAELWQVLCFCSIGSCSDLTSLT